MSATDPIRVHVVDSSGAVRFNCLLDGGGDTVPFKDDGWVIRRDCKARGERIVPGWLTLEEMDAQRDIQHPGWREMLAPRDPRRTVPTPTPEPQERR